MDMEAMNAALRAELTATQAYASDQQDIIEALLNERSERRGAWVLYAVMPTCIALGMIIGFGIGVRF